MGIEKEKLIKALEKLPGGAIVECSHTTSVLYAHATESDRPVPFFSFWKNK